MGTPQYGVRVDAVEGPELQLTILSISEDVDDVPDGRDLDFFVRVLADEEATVERDGPLPNLADRLEADGGDLFDEQWLHDNASRYVSVHELSRRRGGVARSAALEAGRWEREDELPGATFRVVASDASLVAHLEAGDTFETASYPAELWAV